MAQYCYTGRTPSCLNDTQFTNKVLKNGSHWNSCRAFSELDFPFTCVAFYLAFLCNEGTRNQYIPREALGLVHMHEGGLCGIPMSRRVKEGKRLTDNKNSTELSRPKVDSV